MSFVQDLIWSMADGHDWIVFELSTGGFGAIQAKSLEAAKSVTLSRLFNEQELAIIRRNDSGALEAFEDEAEPDEEEYFDED